MRYLLTIFSLCVALATSARAQSFTVALLNTNTAGFTATTDDLNFNPTRSSSPYPFRSIPAAQPSTLDCLNLTGENPTTVETRCFKNFPQFFQPYNAATPPAPVDGYRLEVCNTSNPLVRSRVDLNMVLSNFVQGATSTPYPSVGSSAASQIDQNQILYQLDSANWQAVPVQSIIPTVRRLDRAFLPATPTSTERCRVYDLKLRFRLNGVEESLENPISTQVTFSVAVFP
jgi:hypothetical protein